MKQNGVGIRLVQRKFAQGVPVPAGAGAPPPPERKPDPPREDLTVYHSRMSARNLLDVVALQNVHRHKQPMVLVERLRVDAIPSPAPPVAIKKRIKAKKNQMCLRPREKSTIKYTRKRKSKEAVKGPAKKRACKGRQKSSSANEDDMPLLYLSNSSSAKPKTETTKGPASKEEQNFKFKRPSKSVLLKYRQFQRTRSSTTLSSGRMSASVLSVKGQTRRSLRRPRAAEPARVAKRAPRKLPAKTKKGPKPSEPPAVVNTDKIATHNDNSEVAEERQPSVSAQRATRHRTNSSWSVSTLVSVTESDCSTNQGPTSQHPQRAHRLNKSIVTASTQIATLTEVESVGSRAPSPCPSNSYNSVQEVVVATTSQCSTLQRRCRKCRGCVIVDKIIQLTRLVKPVCRNPGAVYDFNNELDEAMCPSLSCLRNRRRLAKNAEEENHLFLDLLPPHSPHIIQIICKRTADKQFLSAACIVNRDVMTSSKQPSLIEHENLLDQLLECMGRRAEGAPAAATSSDSQLHYDGDTSSDNQLHYDGDTFSDDRNAAEIMAGLNTTIQMQPDALSEASSVGEPESARGVTVFLPPSRPSGEVLEAPTFYPTEEEFTDPIEYYKKIEPLASKFGLCKIVAPAGFKPPCHMSEHIRFAVIYQYISKLYSRWGPVSRELAAIKAHLRTQSVVFARSPLLDGSEVNLPKLYHSVQRNGGPTKVIQRKRWGRVAEEMKLTKLQNPERKLDQIFMRYLLPYATLSNQERQEKMADVEKCWTQKYQKMLYRARNPFHRQKRLLGEAESSEDEADDGDTAGALHEAEDCIVQGRTMNLATFKKIATSLMEAHFDGVSEPDARAVEKAYWRAVLLGTEHIVANTASIDTGEEGYGFPKTPEAEYGTHPWNLKMLAKNPRNVLRFLGPVLGVTVPTLHLSMLFSTSCWHRDPHGLPWTEFMHTGPEKIWYGISSEQSGNFRRAVETLCPAYCQNKAIWLASDIAMIPPEILSEHDVKLSRLTQRPGEYVMVFPEAHTCSITTGYCISESVYFASDSWLETVYKLFQELRNSCEPTMFSLEQLLINGGEDEEAPRRVLLPICSVLGTLVSAELDHRRVLDRKGVKVQVSRAEARAHAWSARDQDECEFCRCTLYLSKVTGLTGRKSSVCAEHAIRLLEMKKYKQVDVKSLDFLSTFSTSMLEEMLDKLERRVSD